MTIEIMPSFVDNDAPAGEAFPMMKPQVSTDQSLQRALEDRFSRRTKEVGPLVCEFTRQEDYLHQYFLMRGPLIAKTFGWQNFDGSEDEYDRSSHVLIARRGNHVIGGARIIVRSPRNNTPLLLESKDYSLIDKLPELRLQNASYCEISRLAILEEFQNSSVIYQMFDRIWQKCNAINAAYTFATVSLPGIRVYRKVTSDLGVDTAWIKHLTLPSKPHYEGVNMLLYMMKVPLNSSGVGTYHVWNEGQVPVALLPQTVESLQPA